MTTPFPTLTAPIEAHYDASTLATADGATPTTWPDLSGKGRDLTAHGSPTFRATRWPGSRPSVSLHRATSDYFQGATASDWTFLSDGTPYTAYVVWRSNLPRAVNVYPSDAVFGLLDTGGGADSTVGTYLSAYDDSATINGVAYSTSKGVTPALAITVPQTIASISARASSIQSRAFGSAVTAGNSLVAILWHFGDPALRTVTGVVDTAGNVYAQDKRVVNGLNVCEVWKCSNVVGGSALKITATLSGSAFVTISGLEAAGLANAAVIDVSVANTGTSPTAVATGAMTTTSANDLILATFAIGGLSTVTTPAGFTEISRSATGGASEDGEACYKIVSSVQTGLTVTWTETHPSTPVWSALAIAYRQPARVYQASGSSAVLPAGTPHCYEVLCDGTTVAVSDWGGTAIIPATANTLAFVGTAPAYGLSIGGNIHSSSNFLDGAIAEVIIFRGALSAADRNLLRAYLEAKWHPGGNTIDEQLLGTDNQYAISGPALSAAPIVRHGTTSTFERAGTGAGWDQDKNYFHLQQFGPGDYRGWVNCLAAADAFEGTEYITSTDLVTFAKPVLNQVAYNASTANNLLHAQGDWFTDVVYDLTAPSDQRFLALLTVWQNSGAQTGIRLLKSPDGIVWTLIQDVYNHNSVDSSFKEGHSLVRRNDGRYVAYYTSGHSTQARSTGQFVSDTTDPAGTWTDQGVHPAFVSPASTNQVYELHVNVIAAGLWVGAATRYNSTSGQTWIDMFASRDEGHSWSLVGTQWVPLAASGWDSGQLYSAHLIPAPTGANWQVWYDGSAQLHGASPYNYDDQLGYAIVPQRRLARIGANGTLTTRTLYQPGQVLSVNADASLGSITAACLDAQGAVITGYADAQSSAISSDTRAGVISWGGLGMPSQTVRVRFTMVAATLYSYTVVAPASAIPSPVSVVYSGGIN